MRGSNCRKWFRVIWSPCQKDAPTELESASRYALRFHREAPLEAWPAKAYVTGAKIQAMAPTPVRHVTVTIDDIIYEGTYFVRDSMVYVQSEFGTKATQVGGSRPATLAKLLLSELVREAKKP